MSTTNATQTNGTTAKGPAGDEAIESMIRALGQCRSRVDEMLVQIDLAQLDLREEVDQHMSVAQNAYLAARSKLADTKPDVTSAFAALHKSVERVLHDLARACVEVDAVVKRES